jgi:hypothetical protein
MLDTLSQHPLIGGIGCKRVGKATASLKALQPTVQTSPGVGDGETGGVDGGVLGTYFHVLPGMQGQAVERMSDILM